MNLAVYFGMSQMCMNSETPLVVPLVTISILLPCVGDLLTLSGTDKAGQIGQPLCRLGKIQ